MKVNLTLTILSLFLMLKFASTASGQCDPEFYWASWDYFTGQNATATIDYNGQIITAALTTNYDFDANPDFYAYGGFVDFDYLFPNDMVPRVVWALGGEGITEVCFSSPIKNPVLVLSSLGSPTFPVTLDFSRPYIPIFEGGAVTFINEKKIHGEEGRAILLFPGNIECITIVSDSTEYNTNITWGINDQAFETEISGDLIACDSTILTVSGGVSYEWSGGEDSEESVNVIKESGCYFVTATDANGCTAINAVIIDILGSNEHISDHTICEGENYNGYTSSGTYVDTVEDVYGCDSVLITNLTVIPNVISEEEVFICEGESYLGFSTTGIYNETYISTSGCDSLFQLNLTVYPMSNTIINADICENDSYQGYTQSGTYVDTLLNINFCDSVRLLELTVLPLVANFIADTICHGETYYFNGIVQTEAGIYYDTLLSENNCDSIVKLDLHMPGNEMLGNDTVICYRDEYTITSRQENTQWFDQTMGSTISVNDSGEYWAWAIDESGCQVVDTIAVQFSSKVYLPNIFSPNFDGFNDRFEPGFTEYFLTSYNIQVFNRWGAVVFASNNPQEYWDGTFKNEACSQGVYAFLIEIETPECGHSVLKGDLTLIR